MLETKAIQVHLGFVFECEGFSYVFSCCHWLAFNMEVTEEKGLLYMEETVLRIRTFLFYVTYVEYLTAMLPLFTRL